MPFTLGPGATGDKLAAKQDAGTDVICEVSGDVRTISGSTDAYGSLFQGALSTTATALVGPAAGTDIIISNMMVTNTGASTRVITFYKTKDSTTYDTSTTWGATIVLLAFESAGWDDGWTIYNVNGVAKRAEVSGAQIITNASIAEQSGFAADTYLAGSNLALPTGLIRAGSSLFWRFDVVKTAAGSATPTVIVRFGTAAAIGDTARLTFTFAAQSAAIDRGIIEVGANFRTIGSGTAAVLAGSAQLDHQLATTGLNSTTTGMQTLAVTSGGFDSTVANSSIGLSVNGGASAAWTVTVVQAWANM